MWTYFTSTRSTRHIKLIVKTTRKIPTSSVPGLAGLVCRGEWAGCRELVITKSGCQSVIARACNRKMIQFQLVKHIHVAIPRTGYMHKLSMCHATTEKYNVRVRVNRFYIVLTPPVKCWLDSSPLHSAHRVFDIISGAIHSNNCSEVTLTNTRTVTYMYL